MQNQFKKALKNGQMQYGFWLGLTSPVSAELLSLTGYDWLLIDAEHAPNDVQTALAQLQAIENSPSHAIVRLVDDQTSRIKQYLDIGAQTLLIPMVETATQAQSIINAMHYPPRGVRGVGTALARAAQWNLNKDYLKHADNEVCLLIQIESQKGIDNLDEILRLEGIDGVFIGPADLAASMGYLGQPSHPKVIETIEQACQKIKQAGKAIGTLATSTELAKHYQSHGMQFIALGVDTLILSASAKSLLSAHRQQDEGDNETTLGNGAY